MAAVTTRHAVRNYQAARRACAHPPCGTKTSRAPAWAGRRDQREDIRLKKRTQASQLKKVAQPKRARVGRCAEWYVEFDKRFADTGGRLHLFAIGFVDTTHAVFAEMRCKSPAEYLFDMLPHVSRRATRKFAHQFLGRHRIPEQM